MRDQFNVDRRQLLSEALRTLGSGIELLDRAHAPAHIAAHVDLAMHQLRDVIDEEVADSSLDQIDRNAAPQ